MHKIASSGNHRLSTSMLGPCSLGGREVLQFLRGAQRDLVHSWLLSVLTKIKWCPQVTNLFGTPRTKPILWWSESHWTLCFSHNGFCLVLEWGGLMNFFSSCIKCQSSISSKNPGRPMTLGRVLVTTTHDIGDTLQALLYCDISLTRWGHRSVVSSLPNTPTQGAWLSFRVSWGVSKNGLLSLCKICGPPFRQREGSRLPEG